MSGGINTSLLISGLRSKVKDLPDGVARKFSLSDAPLLEGLDIEENWKDRLHGLLTNFTEGALHELKRHEDNEPTKEEMNRYLKTVYAILSGKLHEKLGVSAQTKSLIKSQLLIGIENCTQGYLDRLSMIVQDVAYAVSNFDELLFMLRRDLVDRVARATTDEVHAHHRFIKIANDEFGFGLIARDDSCPGAISDRIIKLELERAIQNLMMPTHFVQKVCEQIEVELNKLGYIGCKQDGYESELYHSMAIKLAKLLGYSDLFESGVNIRDYFISDDETYKVTDINWKKVARDVYHKLGEEDYASRFDESRANSYEAARALAAYILGYGTDAELQAYVAGGAITKGDIAEVFHMPSASRQLHVISLLLRTAPTAGITKSIIAHILRAADIKSEFDKLLQSMDVLEKQARDNILEQVLLYRLHSGRFMGMTVLMIAARYQPAVVPSILAAANSITDAVQKARVLSQILTQPDLSFWNPLMLAIREQPAVAPSILAAANSITDAVQKAWVLERILTDSDSSGWNAMILGAGHHPEVVPQILAAVDSITDAVQKARVLEKMLTQSTVDGWNVLMASAWQHPEVVPQILAAAESIDDPEQKSRVLENMLVQENRFRRNALSIAIKRCPDQLDNILNSTALLSAEARYAILSSKAYGGITGYQELVVNGGYPNIERRLKQMYLNAMPINQFYERVKHKTLQKALHGQVARNRVRELFAYYVKKNEGSPCLPCLSAWRTQHALRIQIARQIAADPSVDITADIRRVYSKTTLVHLTRMCGLYGNAIQDFGR